MRVLVTGGAGFIGSHIVEQLLASGALVRILDLVDSGTPSAAELVVGDVRDPSTLQRAVVGIDAVCHQAATVGLGVDFGDVSRYVSHNDLGTAALLRSLWETGFAGRFVLASSMVVYGEGHARCGIHGLVTPAARRVEDLAAGRFEPLCPEPGCPERTTWAAVGEKAPLDPRNIYAATKVHQEQLCALWGRESGATVLALRYHNVYGSRMPRDTPYAGVASIFLSALASGQAPRVFEDGAQTRDFIHVRDVARANVLALTTPGVSSGAFNVASGTPHTVAQMARALATSFGGSSPVVTGDWRLGDVRHVVASPEKAARELEFEAQVSFEEGMGELAGEAMLASTR